MKCPKCMFENPEGASFCNKCGNRLLIDCSECGHVNPTGSEFCNRCGHKIGEEEKEKTPLEGEGERKHVTVLYSDLSGYTAMSEKLDPEEVKEITSRIFGEISQVVANYDGFIEKFVGDAVMALFGVPKAHEDDPLRAIRAAREIHDLVEAKSPELEGRIGRPLSMHTGINTGLVVTGKVETEKGTHGVAGDTINLASRLSGVAKAGEIVVGPETYRQAEGYFTFESLEPTRVKGKAEAVQIYKVLSPKEEPRKIHRLQGLRADLIGRKVEMAQLGEAVENLRKGNGSIFSIYGDAGTGKSRLVEEFKATLDLKQIQWREGHAYPYSQNVPYFPLIDLLSRAFQIEEGDPPEKVREKVESGIEYLVGKKEDIVPYVGSLYALSYPEIEGVSPEFWKPRLQEAIQAILSGLTQRGPTVICLEDLHWADPSSTELLRAILIESRSSALFLCVYRPPFSLFTSHQISGMGKLYREIRLQDLSPSEAQGMVESLLKTETIPPELGRFVQERVEGNPFYLEEVINALIESGTLLRDNGTWRLERPISKSDIPSTVQGVISARLDRLEREMKRILQEASVIGRAFLYEILKKITDLKEQTDRCLHELEQLDLIRTRALQPDLEYIFKHALTQEVVYNGLLKKERKEIHERIACVMEELFHERLSEFHEALAFHFKQGLSESKAVDYLMKSGEKCLKRYSVEESHQYYKEAFDLLTNKPERSMEENALLIELIIKWALVFYYRGDFKGLTALLEDHRDVAESLDDKDRLGMFYAWLAWANVCRANDFKKCKHLLLEALKIGEETGNQELIAYACTWLGWADCAFDLEEAVAYSERAQKLSKVLDKDQYIFFKSLGGIGFAAFFTGDWKRAFEAGKALLDYGQKHSNIRSMVLGHIFMGCGHLGVANLPSAIECFQNAVNVSADPQFDIVSAFFLGVSLLQNGQVQEAEDTLQEVLDFSRRLGFESYGMAPYGNLGVMSIIKGRLNQGSKTLEESIRFFMENDAKCFQAIFEHTLGKVYLQMTEGPLAKKAEAHFNTAIEIAKEIKADGILGQTYLDLGLLHKTNKKTNQARECISKAMKIFERYEREVYLKQAKEALEKLG